MQSVFIPVKSLWLILLNSRSPKQPYLFILLQFFLFLLNFLVSQFENSSQREYFSEEDNFEEKGIIFYDNYGSWLPFLKYFWLCTGYHLCYFKCELLRTVTYESDEFSKRGVSKGSHSRIRLRPISVVLILVQSFTHSLSLTLFYWVWAQIYLTLIIFLPGVVC